jgi:hypothetical protein
VYIACVGKQKAGLYAFPHSEKTWIPFHFILRERMEYADLPEEIHAIILRLADTGRARMVCHDWNAIMDAIRWQMPQDLPPYDPFFYGRCYQYVKDMDLLDQVVERRDVCRLAVSLSCKHMPSFLAPAEPTDESLARVRLCRAWHETIPWISEEFGSKMERFDENKRLPAHQQPAVYFGRCFQYLLSEVFPRRMGLCKLEKMPLMDVVMFAHAERCMRDPSAPLERAAAKMMGILQGQFFLDEEEETAQA